MVFTFNPVLEDKNYRLTKLREEHFEGLYKIANNKTLWMQHPQHDRWKREVFEVFFKDALQNPICSYVYEDKLKNIIIGSSRFYELDEGKGSVKIGYTFLDPGYWGGPTNFAFKKLMLDHAFETLEKVYFDIGLTNYRSQKACEKIGGIRVGENDKGNALYLLEKGTWEDMKRSLK